MFAKFITSSLLVLAAASSVSAHAAFAPALGVAGTPARSDVQRPSTNAECGSTNIASALATSTAVPLAADGTFTVTATDFNAGADGSRSVKTALVDPTGTGKSFTAATVKTNGNANPTTVGSDQITIAMPAGTTCSGGADGASCLVSLTTTAGFGNCVVVSSAATAGAANAATGAAATTAAAGTAATATTAAAATATTTGKHHHHKGVGSAAAQAAAVAKAEKQQAAVAKAER